MDIAAFRKHARAQFAELSEELGDTPGSLRIGAPEVPHPVVPGLRAYASHGVATDPEPAYTVNLHHGSFAALLAEDPSIDPMQWIAERLETEIDEALATLEGAEELSGEEGLFAAHAAFRAGQEAPFAFWRLGEALADACWCVDLDVFVELDLLRHEWDGLLGTHVRLLIAGETVEVALPEDADPDEVLTLPGAGLMEEDPAAESEADEDDEAGQEADLLRAGALHLIPVLR